jgi:hypothetical protein
MADFETLRELALALPEVTDGTAYGARALKLNGKLLACVPTHKSAEANCAVVRIDFERRAQLLERHPEVYYLTEHYLPHPTVLIRLSRITVEELRQLLREAWRFVGSAPAARRRPRAPRKSPKPSRR